MAKEGIEREKRERFVGRGEKGRMLSSTLPRSKGGERETRKGGRTRQSPLRWGRGGRQKERQKGFKIEREVQVRALCVCEREDGGGER